MPRSMTGFGVGRAALGPEELVVELKSVNHKFCEVKARLPRELGSLELSVTKQVKDRLARGFVELTVKRTGASASGNAPTVDEALAKSYRVALSALAKAAGVPDEVSLTQLASLPGVLRLDEAGLDLEAAGKALEQAVERALQGLVAMRETEGKTLAVDLGQRLAAIAALVGEIRELVPVAVQEYQHRLQLRVQELSNGVSLDPARLSQEVVVFAERTDVAEELTRLGSHLAQFKSLLGSKEPSGRKLDFLVQEMNREVNTTGSKSQHAEISARIVALKAELERIREQVQNIE